MSSAPPAPRGAFIVFEGLDRSGKSSQAKILVDKLNEAGAGKAEYMNFPARTTQIGSLINNYLKGTPQGDLHDNVVHLLFAANRWEAEKAIRAKLAAGTTLVVDRYSFSGVGFSAAKGLSQEWCYAPEVGLPAPDVVFYLSVTEDVAAQRGGYGEERYERKEFQQAVATQFSKMLQQALGGCEWIAVDGGQSMADVTAEIQSKAMAVVAAAQTAPLKTMQPLPAGAKA